MEDRNKTRLTHEVTAAVARYLDERGFKPVETEVQVCRGWCADLAGVITPCQTELIDLGLITRRPRYGYDDPRQTEWNMKLLTLFRMMTCLVEVKTSRGDFRGDRKWGLALPTDLAYVAVPSGLIREDEWPPQWGVLSYKDGRVTRLRPPTPRETHAVQQRDVIHNIAVRRDHHTRNARWREEQKEQRLRDIPERNAERYNDVIGKVLSVATGERTPEELDEYRRLRGQSPFPWWVMNALKQLHGIKPEEAACED